MTIIKDAYLISALSDKYIAIFHENMAVNTASRMESNSLEGRIHLSDRAASILAAQASLPCFVTRAFVQSCLLVLPEVTFTLLSIHKSFRVWVCNAHHNLKRVVLSDNLEELRYVSVSDRRNVDQRLHSDERL